MDKNYYSKEAKLLKIFGVSFDKKQSAIYKIYSTIVLTGVPYFYVVVGGSVLFEDMKFEDFYITFTYLIAICLALLKLTFLIVNRFKLIGVIRELYLLISSLKDIEIVTSTCESKLIKDCVNFNNNQRNVYWTVALPNIFYPLVISLFTRFKYQDYHKWEHAFGAVTIIDTSKSPNFELIVLYQFLAFSFYGVIFVCSDLIFVEILSHLGVLFKVLQKRLEFLTEISYEYAAKDMKHKAATSKNTTDNNVSPIYFQKALKDVVILHLKVLNLTNQVKQLYSILLLLMYVLNVTVLCFALYMASVLQGNKIVVAYIGMAVMCCQLLFICYWCDDLTTQSETLGSAAYNASFVGTPIAFQKDLAFIMRRSLNPDIITAWNFFGVRLTTFLKILQAAYSYCMVMRRNIVNK